MILALSVPPVSWYHRKHPITPSSDKLLWVGVLTCLFKDKYKKIKKNVSDNRFCCGPSCIHAGAKLKPQGQLNTPVPESSNSLLHLIKSHEWCWQHSWQALWNPFRLCPWLWLDISLSMKCSTYFFFFFFTVVFFYCITWEVQDATTPGNVYVISIICFLDTMFLTHRVYVCLCASHTLDSC